MFVVRAMCFVVVMGGLFASAVTSSTDGDPEKLIKQGHYKDARQIVEKRLAENPKDTDSLVHLARIKLAYKDLDGATKLAEQAVASNSGNAAAHAVLADCYGQRAEGDSGFFQSLKLAHSFTKEADAALAIDPKNLQALHSMMQYYLEAPMIAGGSKSKADEMAARIGAVDAAKGFLVKSEIALHEKQYDQLEGLYLKAVEADPKSYEALVRLTGLYAGEKYRNLQKAEESATRALGIDPNRAGAYGVLAFVKVVREDWTGLDKLLAQAEKNVPLDFSYYVLAGRALLATGKDDPRAEKYFRKYFSQEPEGNAPSLASAHWQLGLVLEKEGKLQDAIKEISTAVNLDASLKGAQKDLKRLQP